MLQARKSVDQHSVLGLYIMTIFTELRNSLKPTVQIPLQRQIFDCGLVSFYVLILSISTQDSEIKFSLCNYVNVIFVITLLAKVIT